MNIIDSTFKRGFNAASDLIQATVECIKVKWKLYLGIFYSCSLLGFNGKAKETVQYICFLCGWVQRLLWNCCTALIWSSSKLDREMHYNDCTKCTNCTKFTSYTNCTNCAKCNSASAPYDEIEIDAVLANANALIFQILALILTIISQEFFSLHC